MTDTRTPIRERVEAAIAFCLAYDETEPRGSEHATDWDNSLRDLCDLAREAVADAEQAHAVPELPEVGPGSTSYELGKTQAQMLQTQALIKDALLDIDEVMLSLCDATDRVGVWRRNVLRDARKALRAALELGGG